MVNLVKLQKVDEKIAALILIEMEGPEKMAAVDAELAAGEDKVNNSLTQEKELLKRRRELEAEVEDTDEKIKSNQGRQLQAKTNEEYRALLKEAEYLRKSNTAREDELLEVMESLETLAKDNKELKVWLEEQRTAAADRKKKIEESTRESVKGKADLLSERESLIKSLPRNFMAAYDRIYKRRNGRAVVGIQGGVCQECHIQIPPQDFNMLQRNEELQVCPNCNRIMYWVDHQDFENIL
jgi:predicted  nucleic acid-binding Zn-ribbon protein